jgi:hypothetical protein
MFRRIDGGDERGRRGSHDGATHPLEGTRKQQGDRALRKARCERGGDEDGGADPPDAQAPPFVGQSARRNQHQRVRHQIQGGDPNAARKAEAKLTSHYRQGQRHDGQVERSHERPDARDGEDTTWMVCDQTHSRELTQTGLAYTP